MKKVIWLPVAVWVVGLCWSSVSYGGIQCSLQTLSSSTPTYIDLTTEGTLAWRKFATYAGGGLTGKNNIIDSYTDGWSDTVGGLPLYFSWTDGNAAPTTGSNINVSPICGVNRSFTIYVAPNTTDVRLLKVYVYADQVTAGNIYVNAVGYALQTIPISGSFVGVLTVQWTPWAVTDSVSIQINLSDGLKGGFPAATLSIPTTGIQGTVLPVDYIGDVQNVGLKVELQPTAGGSHAIKYMVPDINGVFAVKDVTPGTYDVTVKGTSWLSKVIPSVVVNAYEMTNLNTVELTTNGDFDGDDHVTSTDLSIVLANME